MTITLSWSDLQAAYPQCGMHVFFVKDINNDVTRVAIGLLSGTDKILVLSNPPSKNNFLAVYPSAIQVTDIT